MGGHFTFVVGSMRAPTGPEFTVKVSFLCLQHCRFSSHDELVALGA